MGDLYRDPEIDRMIHDLNRDASAAEPLPAGAAGGEDEDGGEALRLQGSSEVLEGPLERLLRTMIAHGASDLLLVGGSPPVVRVDGRLVPLEAEVLDGDDLGALFREHLGRRLLQDLQTRGSADFSLRLAGAGGAHRMRVNIHRQRGELAAAIRALPRAVPRLDDLNLPPALRELVAPSRGLLLVCGPTGAGKTTTLAALVGELTRARSLHVITVEDPLEYRHPPGRGLIEQVEVGTDAPDFLQALRSALRRDPDVLLVGEMRDLATMSAVLTSAETGHLVLSTLHTGDAVRAVQRIVDVFPVAQQAQVRHQLALGLSGIVCQHLLPKIGGGQVPAVEVLRATDAVRNHIRKGEEHQLYNEMVAGRRLGMTTLEASLAELVQRGDVALDEARARATRPEELDRLAAG